MFSVTTLTRRTAHRRLLEVAARPSVATPADIELVLRAHGVREDLIWQVDDFMAATGIEATLVWNWVMDHDGDAFADLVASVPAAEITDELQRAEVEVLAIAS